jgi:inner membrane protein involved in colicin E2 resistance
MKTNKNSLLEEKIKYYERKRSQYEILLGNKIQSEVDIEVKKRNISIYSKVIIITLIGILLGLFY